LELTGDFPEYTWTFGFCHGTPSNCRHCLANGNT
jgi:hypothetical protein